eukprot:5701457-Prymnesium_polylepis.1
MGRTAGTHRPYQGAPHGRTAPRDDIHFVDRPLSPSRLHDSALVLHDCAPAEHNADRLKLLVERPGRCELRGAQGDAG